MKVYINGQGHMTKMATMAKTFKNLANTLLFLAHLSRRLTGELIVYPCSGIRRRRPSSFTISKIFSSETTRPIEAKLHVEHP